MGRTIPLVQLDPLFVGSGGEGVTDKDGNPVPRREGIGLSFRCPCGKHDEYDRVFVTFANPIDGGPPLDRGYTGDRGLPTWHRTGETFETMTLSPSIQRADPNGCRWHGHIINGAAVDCG